MATNLTPPQFIWQCLCSTPDMAVTVSSTGKRIQYAPPELTDVPDSRCWLCGGETHGRGRLVSVAVDEMFSDTQFAREPTSGSLCEACAGLKAQRPLRNYSPLAAGDRLSHPSRPEWRQLLVSPPEPPWAACLAVSGQKHLFFRTAVNHDNRVIRLALEDRLVETEPRMLASLLSLMESMLAVFSKEELRTRRYSPPRIPQYGLQRWKRDDARLQQAARNTGLFALALYVAQIPDREAYKAEQQRREEVGRVGHSKAQIAQEVDHGGPAQVNRVEGAGLGIQAHSQGDKQRPGNRQGSFDLPF